MKNVFVRSILISRLMTMSFKYNEETCFLWELNFLFIADTVLTVQNAKQNFRENTLATQAVKPTNNFVWLYVNLIVY